MFDHWNSQKSSTTVLDLEALSARKRDQTKAAQANVQCCAQHSSGYKAWILFGVLTMMLLYCSVDALEWYNLCQDLYQLKADHSHPNWVACALIGSLASCWGRCPGARVKVRCISHIAASPLYNKYYIYLWLPQHSVHTLRNIFKVMRQA